MGETLTAVREKRAEVDQVLGSVVTSLPPKETVWRHIDTAQHENGNQPHTDDLAVIEDVLDDELFNWSEEDFPNGWRFVQMFTADGQEIWEQIPLTEYDLLHPQDGDEIMNTTPHGKNITYLDTSIGTLYKSSPGTVILNDVGVDLDLPGIEHVSPDIAVIFDVTEVKDWGIFYCQEEGVRPSVIFEVTSPSTRKNDFSKKYDYYQQAGIPFYVILDVKYGADKQVAEYRLHVYELVSTKYVKAEPGAHGRYWLPPLGIWIGLGEDGILCYDEMGNILLSHDELAQALVDSEQRREEATQHAEEQEQRAEEQGQRADEQEKQAQQERVAKEAAEKEVARLRAIVEQLGGKL